MLPDLAEIRDQIESLKDPALRKHSDTTWAVYGWDYPWGDPHARSTYWKVSRELTEYEAMEVYIRFKIQDHGYYDMKDLFKAHADFVLGHYSIEQLKTHIKDRKDKEKVNRKKELLAEIEKAKVTLKAEQDKLAELQAQLDS